MTGMRNPIRPERVDTSVNDINLIVGGFAFLALAFSVLAIRSNRDDLESLFWGLAMGCGVGALIEWLVF